MIIIIIISSHGKYFTIFFELKRAKRNDQKNLDKCITFVTMYKESSRE